MGRAALASLSGETGIEEGSRRDGPVEAREQADARVLVLQGDWTAPSLVACERALAAQVAAPAARLRFDLARVGRIDTAGAWLIQREVRAREVAGVPVEVIGATESVATLLATVTRHDVEHPPIEPPYVNPVVALIERLGAGTFSVLNAATELVNFLGLLLVTLARCLVQCTARDRPPEGHLHGQGPRALGEEVRRRDEDAGARCGLPGVEPRDAHARDLAARVCG